MQKLVLSLAVAFLIGGCTSKSEIAQDSTSQAGRDAGAQAKLAGTKQVSVRSVASMPDRGELFAYNRALPPVRRSAETFRAVDLSEAHALNAAQAGKGIDLPLPSGARMHVDFVRREQGIDGNWSWVGRTPDGLDAVITFGDKAVFGRIGQRNTEALRLTTLSGRTWLVETDPSRMYDGNLLRNAKRSDMVIPSSTVAGIVSRKRSAQAAKTVVAAGDAAVGPADTVDVVLGYTNGLVTKYGGDSAANTRLSNLIALTNQAYINSQITARVRLVRTVAVNYTDTNSNDAALDAVTGQTCTISGCTAITVPTELVPLRTARDTYGGDIVSLVRPFQAPQQTGCGLAWLLGADGSAIDSSDATFGYSVVSDGSDIDETDGRNYFCRDESLAHEMGHNMGQQHNVEDSGGTAGTHSYSYGYRESSTTGFYTIMAYRLSNSSQFSINYFANPNVTYTDTGRATGTATNDNARSLNTSMPLVAQFRTAVVPFGGKAHNDFNGDGKSDIVLWNSSVSYLGYWIMNGSVYTGSAGFTLASGFAPASTGFLSNIPQASLLARNTSTQTLYSYIWNGTTHAQGTIGGAPAGWDAIGEGDLNGDGKDDLLWRNPSTGQFAYWLMNGAVYLGGNTYGPPATYVVAGIADFNGDGMVDLLWNDPGTRNASIWLSTGSGFTVAQIGQYGTDWNMVGTADVTGDGKADIILRDNANVYLAYWKMNGAVYQGSSAFGLAADRSLFTTGDFNGDGIEDLVIQRASDRTLWLWTSNGTVFAESNIGQYGTGWSVLR